MRWGIGLALALAAAGAEAQQAPPRDVVVTGTTEAPSIWKRADGRHVTVFSDGSAPELARVTASLERLHHLLNRLYRNGATADETVPLRIMLVGSARRLRGLGLPDSEADYYARADGAVLTMARVDQSIDLNTNRRFQDGCDAFLMYGDSVDARAANCSAAVPHRMPVVRPWEAALYAAFARHFLLTYAPAAYPAWYLDGVGALFSTVRFRSDGGIDYATAPAGYRDIFLSYGVADVAGTLAGRAPADGRKAVAWSPYQAWLLAHFFLFADARAKWSAPFRRYMAAAGRGEPLAEAAAAFGRPARLQRDIQIYLERPTAFARTEASAVDPEPPVATTLSDSAGRLVEARLELDARIDHPADGDAGWLASLRDRLGATGEPAAALLLAEASCRLRDYDGCLADATRVPRDGRAAGWRAIALAASGAGRASDLSAARAALEQAIGSDHQPLAAMALFDSYAAAGEPVPDTAMLALAGVMRGAPGAPAPRLALAAELIRRGQGDLVRRVLHPVLYGGQASPEQAAAHKLVAAGAPAAAEVRSGSPEPSVAPALSRGPASSCHPPRRRSGTRVKPGGDERVG